MEDVLGTLCATVAERVQAGEERSYTCYLFREGLDKILKKCGEEMSEVLIAAKNGEKTATVGEISDLLYHLAVMMVHEGIAPEEVAEELARRHTKTGNLKNFHQTDRNT